ncbi:accessory factor UbiK family protein [Segnochrobactraceae bacterium EtOH-i3]
MREGNRFLDDLAKLATDAASVAGGMRREVETAVRSQLERLLGDMDLVRREEVEVLRAVAAAARADTETLTARVAALEARLAALDGKTADPVPSDDPAI